MVAGVSEALVKVSALYHAYCHMMVIEAEEPVGRLVLVTVFLILCKYYRGCNERSGILFKMGYYGKVVQASDEFSSNSAPS